MKWQPLHHPYGVLGVTPQGQLQVSVLGMQQLMLI